MFYCPTCNTLRDDYEMQRHHKFSNTKQARKLYGPKMLNAEFNIQIGCCHCHSSHASSDLEHWSEEKFCIEATAFFGYTIEPRSKTAQNKKLKEVV